MSFTKALLVTDLVGVLYYASLGDNISNMEETMRKDFESLKQPVNLKTISANEEINKTIQNYKLMLTDEGNMDDLKIGYKILFGTPFQRKVWIYLCERVPSLKTITYSQLAEGLNMPKASRAVANACGANKIALVIPCHRVNTKLGKITGYRWGIPLKRKILKLEQENSRLLKFKALKDFRSPI